MKTSISKPRLLISLPPLSSGKLPYQREQCSHDAAAAPAVAAPWSKRTCVSTPQPTPQNWRINPCCHPASSHHLPIWAPESRPWRPGPVFLLSLETLASDVIPESPDPRDQIPADNNVIHVETLRSWGRCQWSPLRSNTLEVFHHLMKHTRPAPGWRVCPCLLKNFHLSGHEKKLKKL